MKTQSSKQWAALVAIASCCVALPAMSQDNQNMPPPETRTGAPMDQPVPAPDPSSAGASTMPQGSATREDADATGTEPDATSGTDSDSDSASPADSGDVAATPGATMGANLDQATIEKFADAYVAVQSIQHKAASDLQKTSDPAQADKVKSSAQTDMIAAVERSGLQVEEFNQIVQSMAADNNIRSRVAAEVQKRSPPASSAAPSDPTNSGGG